MKSNSRSAFTLIEVLVAVAIIALLLAVLVPGLSAAREAGRTSVCASNLRQAYLACRAYADGNRGYGPAIGVTPNVPPPAGYNLLPNWGLVVQKYTGRGGSKVGSLYEQNSVLVCPSARMLYGDAMTRTYAMNATGHAGQTTDPDNYDDPGQPGHIRFDRVRRAGENVLLLDSARAPIVGTAPPSVRTASMIDFRNPDHIQTRLGWFHRRGGAFNAVAFDGSCRAYKRWAQLWQIPLP